MTQAALDSLKPTLDALPKVKAPPMPVSEALAEANALLSFLNDDLEKAKGDPNATGPGAAAQTKLHAVGLPADHIQRYAQATDALRFSQALQQSNGQRVFNEADLQAIAAAHTLRGDIMTACRWNLRKDRIAQGTLDRIAEGDGLPDLLSDLGALAVLILAHASAFSSDNTFDPTERAQTCNNTVAHVKAIAAAAANASTSDKTTLTDTRNRAWTHFKALQKDLRDAAGYAFRHDPQTLKHFVSPYNKKRYTRSKTATPTTLP